MARAFYRTTRAWDSCVQLNLALGLREFTRQQPSPGNTPRHALFAYAWAMYEEFNTCLGTRAGAYGSR